MDFGVLISYLLKFYGLEPPVFVSRAPKVQNGQNSLVFKIDLCINLNITVKGGLHQLTVHSCVEIMLCTRYTVYCI